MLNHVGDDSSKILKTDNRNDNRVPTSVDIFCNSQKPSTGVFVQIKKELFALNLNLLTVQWVVH